MDIDRVDIADIFSERATKMAKQFGLTPGDAFGLKSGWDLSKPHVRRDVRHKRRSECPALVVGIPLWTEFSMLDLRTSTLR